ncbi:hypothetical protein FHP29_02255 [Nocardioides albidus]|uniref:Uncharacterized protein n=1 Tax=Nocardioides albidus TaxID=1517589 RepID=A0A5C4WJ84_9ACTN|nr:hypothetical protein FHP29_02255 [Nocardioides albidus]
MLASSASRLSTGSVQRPCLTSGAARTRGGGAGRTGSTGAGAAAGSGSTGAGAGAAARGGGPPGGSPRSASTTERPA